VNQGVQGSPEALGPKCLTGNRHRPSGLVCSGEDTLCGGRGDTLGVIGGLHKAYPGLWNAAWPCLAACIGPYAGLGYAKSAHQPA
jgi:hypothetical protein